MPHVTRLSGKERAVTVSKPTVAILMADDNPADDAAAFLLRENELLGDEFKTEHDLHVSESEDDLAEFKQQFPEVDLHPQDDVVASAELQDADFSELQLAPVDAEAESAPLREWRERRALEIETRDNAGLAKKQEVVAKARQTIDDFYENYNQKLEDQAQARTKETEAFLEHRDKFLSRGTLWDRVDELIGQVRDVPEADGRDKLRFASLLKSLKGKENAPGAGGYTDPQA